MFNTQPTKPPPPNPSSTFLQHFLNQILYVPTFLTFSRSIWLIHVLRPLLKYLVIHNYLNIRVPHTLLLMYWFAQLECNNYNTCTRKFSGDSLYLISIITNLYMLYTCIWEFSLMAYFYPKSLEWRADRKCSIVELDKKKKFFKLIACMNIKNVKQKIEFE